MTLTFEVESSNHALLLLALYDIINKVPPDDSIVITDNIEFLIDTLLDAAPEIASFMDCENLPYGWQLKMMSKPTKNSG